MASLLKRGLEEEGYAVDIAADGLTAVWMGSEYPYDAVVLDVMLPDIDGFGVCRKLRESGRWSPVLMLTARDAVHDRVAGLDAGNDDYLTKPFSFAELRARLRALLRRGEPERPVVLEADDLVVDPATHRVTRGGVPIQLTRKEFALLEYVTAELAAGAGLEFRDRGLHELRGLDGPRQLLSLVGFSDDVAATKRTDV